MKRYVLIVLTAIMVIACTQHEVDDVLSGAGEGKIYASIMGSDTKVQLNELKQTVWTAGDRIYVIGPDHYGAYTFDGNTGDRSGSFTRTAEGTPPDQQGYYFDQYYAIYSNFISYGRYSNGDGVIFAQVPQVQQYMDHSYGLSANTMVATSQDGVNFSFKNVLGYLRLSLIGDKKVRSIALHGNNNEIMSGIFYFDLGDIYNHIWYDQLSNSIVLDCLEEGIQLSETPQEFYMVVPPVTFSGGFTISVNFTDGTSCPQSTSKNLQIEANTIYPMATVNTSESGWAYMYINHTGEAVSYPILIGESSVTGVINFGDGTSASAGGNYIHNYVDANPSHTITVKSKGAEGFVIYGCDGITKIDLSNF
ncbi:MAG: hypothetical protein J6U80_07255 [Bacteroidales bacterium]|nr:hypothetical protein [Bacteroidales bacterium]